MTETRTIGLALLAVGILLAVSAVATRIATRTPVPVVLVFMAVGMLAGSEGLGRIHFDDHREAFRIGTAALVLILFGGALNTPVKLARPYAGPAVLLATVGVALTAGLVGAAALLFGFGPREALLLGAVVSSTDAAAVFAVLRGSGIQLARRVGLTLELESGMNDPMAVLLTIAMTAMILGTQSPLALAWQLPVQLLVGVGTGIAVGWAAHWLLRKLPPFAGGLFPVLTVAFAFCAFGAATLLFGSGFLAVYIAGLTLSATRLPYRSGLVRVHDFLGWLAQVVMFLVLGLLVFPSHLVEVMLPGLAIALFLVFVARPVVVLACLAPLGYPLRECVYIGWVGLRGAVPIVLATFPIFSGVPAGERIFNVVFFVVVVSVLLQGTATRALTRWLRLESGAPPPPPAAVEITSTRAVEPDLLCFYIAPESAVAGVTIAELPFPPDAAVVLVLRGPALLPARGTTRLEVGDHVYVFCSQEDEPVISLMFGRKLGS